MIIILLYWRTGWCQCRILFTICITAFMFTIIIALAVLQISSLHSAIIAPDYSYNYYHMLEKCPIILKFFLIKLPPIILKITLAHKVQTYWLCQHILLLTSRCISGVLFWVSTTCVAFNYCMYSLIMSYNIIYNCLNKLLYNTFLLLWRKGSIGYKGLICTSNASFYDIKLLVVNWDHILSSMLSPLLEVHW